MKYEQLVHRILNKLQLEVGEDVNENTVPELCKLIDDTVVKFEATNDLWRRVQDGLPQKPGIKNYEHVDCLIYIELT